MNHATGDTVRHMERTHLMSLVAAAVMLPAFASAQTAGNEPEATLSITTTTQRASSSREAWLLEDLADMEARITRSRNALIATSASTAVGTVLIAVGAAQCVVVTRPDLTDELECNTAGNVLFPMGFTMTIVSAIGMITSGIILGVANKKKRGIRRDLRGLSAARRLQWDTPSGSFVF
jgi:hypothetical protein